MLVGIDTNILLYAADSAGDSGKHRAAIDLLDRITRLRRGVLSVQALSEFYAVATRKGRATPQAAAALVDVWSEVFPVRTMSIADIADAIRANREHGISFRDAVMWSVLRRAGSRFLVSEDLQDGRELEGVRFVNPFEPENAPVLGTMLADP